MTRTMTSAATAVAPHTRTHASVMQPGSRLHPCPLVRPPAVVGRGPLQSPSRPPAVAGRAAPSRSPHQPVVVGNATSRTPARGTSAVVDAATSEEDSPPRPSGTVGNAASRTHARGTTAVVDAVSAEEDPRKRQFAVAVPLAWTDADWLALLPWQSIAIAHLDQNPGHRKIRCSEGDDYLAFFDYGSVDCPGARPTVVGRVGAVEGGRVLHTREVPWQNYVGSCTPDFAAHATVVEVDFGRAMAGMHELRIALLVVTADLRIAEALDIAAKFAELAPHLVVCCRDAPETRSVQKHADTLVAALKCSGCSLERLWSSEEVVVGWLKEFDGNHSDSEAKMAFETLQDRCITLAAAAGPRFSGVEPPKCKAKRWREQAVLLFFGTPARSKDAVTRRGAKRGRWRGRS